MFVVPPQSPLYDLALPADSVHPLDWSVCAAKCFHEHIYRVCRRKVSVPGLERPANSAVKRCSHCDAELLALRNLDTSRLLVTVNVGF